MGVVQHKCKKCSSVYVVKNGAVRDKQGFKCRDCGYNFILGDNGVMVIKS